MFGPLVWGTVMAPIKKLRDGRGTGLGWHLLNGSTQQPTERVSAVGGGGGEDIRTGGTRGADVWLSFWVANGATKKYLNRDGDGALDFDGFCWIGGHNNQPKIDRIVKLYLG